MPSTNGTRKVLLDIHAERTTQNAKWGEQSHPDGTGPHTVWVFTGPAHYVRDSAVQATNHSADEGTVTWRDILLEEVAEAFAESDPEKLRKELVQVAAVATAWIEHLDRRSVTPTE